MNMKKFQFLSVFILILLITTSNFAQYKSQVPETPTLEQAIRLPNSNSQTGLNLFDPNRFFMNQSYSFSMGFGGHGNQSMGMYLNNMSYIVSNNLIVNARLGFIHNPLQMGSPGLNPNISENLIYGADILYKPTENMQLRLRFDKTPYNRRSYLNPYRYYPYY